MSDDKKDEVAASPDLTKRFHITSNGTVLSTSDSSEDARQQLEDYKVARGKALAEVQHLIAHPNPVIIDRGVKHQPKPAHVKRSTQPFSPAPSVPPAPPPAPAAVSTQTSAQQTTQLASPPSPANPSSSSSGSSSTK